MIQPSCSAEGTADLYKETLHKVCTAFLFYIAKDMILHQMHSLYAVLPYREEEFYVVFG